VGSADSIISQPKNLFTAKDAKDAKGKNFNAEIKERTDP
jgi:hypothetical protein